jgi:hypothetical protein
MNSFLRFLSSTLHGYRITSAKPGLRFSEQQFLVYWFLHWRCEAEGNMQFPQSINKHKEKETKINLEHTETANNDWEN